MTTPTSIDRYTLLYGITNDALIEEVNDYIGKGWKPTGGPFITVNRTEHAVLVQAMVRIKHES